MPYLNLDLDYFTHPKTIRLIGLLGRGAAELPIRLWSYCGKYHCESGNLAGHSAQEIEALVGWWGGSGKMVEAMIAVGFLKKTDGGFKIHDWLDHAGHLSAFKKRAKTAAKAKWKAYASSSASSIAKKKIKQCPLPTLPDHTLPNQQDQTKKKEKRAYGEFKRVLLTDEEYRKLSDRFGLAGAEARITDLDIALQSKAAYQKKYTDHYATILSWDRRNGGSAHKSKEQSRLDDMFKNLKEAFPEAT